MLRYITSLCWVAILLGAASAVRADLVDYTTSYDPVSNTTVLSNGQDSTVDLEFWTKSGSYLGTPLALAPDSSVTIDSSGNFSNVTGTWETWATYSDDPPPNKTIASSKVDKPFTTKGSITITVSSNLGERYTPPVSVTFPNPGALVGNAALAMSVNGDGVSGTLSAFDDDIGIFCNSTTSSCSLTADALFTLSNGASAVYFPDDSPFTALGQISMELLAGTIESADDPADMTSVYNSECSTGCDVPEPLSLVALSGLGAMGLIGCVWRRRHA